MTDAQITAEIYRLLRERYSDSQRFICAREVSDKTGWSRRRLDMVVARCWDSDGQRIEAIEVKASKSDLRHDLENPEKHNIFFDDIDYYTLAAPAEIIDLRVIPPKWGVLALQDGKLVTRRKPIALHDEKNRTLSRSFALSFLRAATNQNPNADKELLSAERRAAYDEGYKMGGISAQNEITRLKRIIEDNKWKSEFISNLGFWSKPFNLRESAFEYRLAHGLYSAIKGVPFQFKCLEHRIAEVHTAYEALVKYLEEAKAECEKSAAASAEPQLEAQA